MANILNVLSKLNIKQNSAIIFDNSDDYPANPSIGQLAFVRKVLSIYSDVNGSATWFPLLNADVPTYTHVQGLESLNWSINHNLDSEDLIYFVYDNNNQVVFPSNTSFLSANEFSLSFTESIKGKCIVFSGDLKIKSETSILDIDGLQDELNSKSDNSHNHNLDDLLNVDIDNKTINNVLLWNGTSWVNNTFADANIAEANHNHDANYLGIGSNAVSASKLVNTRTIAITGGAVGSVAFDGSSNVDITVSITDDSHNHIISNIDGLRTELDSKSNTTHAHDSTYLGITANAVSATKLLNTRTIAITGDVTGSATFDGTVNANINSTLNKSLINKLYSPDGTSGFVYTDNLNNLHIDGNIIQNGAVYESHVEQVYTSQDLIINREGATTGIAVGNVSGLQINNYDGTNNLVFGTDSQGYFKVGETGSLQILSTREDAPVNSALSVWNDATKQFITSSSLTWTSNKLNAPTFVGDLEGNADTTSKLITARTINLTGDVTGSVSFDGSSNVSITTTAATNPTITLAGDVTGSATLTNLGDATLTATVANNSHTHTSANISDASSTNAVNKIVLRDASGNFAANTITANLTGNASTATTATNCSRSVVAGTGLTGGGALSANRTLTVNFGTGVGTVCQGNDSRLSNSRKCNNTFDNAATSRTNLGLSDAATTTVATIRAGTTKANVGLGDVDNYSRAHYDGRYLGKTAKAADADKLDGLNSSQFLRSDANTTINVGRGDVYIENHSDDNINGAGITIRTSNNPSNGDEGTTGSIFSVKSSGNATRLWVGQSVTSTGSNTFTAPLIYEGGTALSSKYLGISAIDSTPVQNSNTTVVSSGAIYQMDVNYSVAFAEQGNAINDLQSQIDTGTSGTAANTLVKRDANGSFSANVITCTTLTQTSDINLKTNVKTIENALDKVSQLRGVSFTFKDDETNKSNIGLIAQEIETIIPEVVNQDIDTGIKSVSYGNIVGLLIESIKDLKNEIDELKAKI